jgi:hypothetical protein
MNINNDKRKICINITLDKRRYKNKIQTKLPDKHNS